jgi:hypothetical protein
MSTANSRVPKPPGPRVPGFRSSPAGSLTRLGKLLQAQSSSSASQVQHPHRRRTIDFRPSTIPTDPNPKDTELTAFLSQLQAHRRFTSRGPAVLVARDLQHRPWFHSRALATPTNRSLHTYHTYLPTPITTAIMSEERLWKFRKPEWLNSVYARNAGVYSAGALVSAQASHPARSWGRRRETQGQRWPRQPHLQ